MIFSEEEQKLRELIGLALEKRGIKDFIWASYKISNTSEVYYGVVKIGGRYFTAQHKNKSDLIKKLIKELE